jgi:glycosidase
MPDEDPENVTADFIFGTLATDELRLAEITRRARGLWHGSQVEPRSPAPGEAVRLSVTAGGDLSVNRVVARYTTDGSMPGTDSAAVELTCLGPTWDTLTWSYLERWTAELPPQDDGVLVRYRIQGIGLDGTVTWADAAPETGEPGLFAYLVGQQEVPAWLRDAVIYQVFVDRFAPDPGRAFTRGDTLSDIWGGTLKGVTANLDHIANLGATVIWLTPVFPSPTHHGYDATDYTAIEPRLGTEDDLITLIAHAHARGIRVLLDFVANHVSNEHPAFRRALADPAAPEREWFTIGDDGSYESFFGVESMPKVVVDHDPAARYMIDAATYWLQRGVDGYRLDHANGPSLAFWAMFRQALRAVKPDVALVGEVVEGAEHMATYEGRLDGTLDFLMLQQYRSFFAFDLVSAAEFWRFVERHLAWMPPHLALPHFLDNHDMNRFLWVVQGDVRRLKIAALVQCALPHPPVIYYGTEVGLSQWHDLEYPDGSRRMEESRTPMPWGTAQDADLRSFYRSLLFWRNRHGVARSMPQHVYAGDGGLLCFRTGQWFVVVNRDEDAAAIDFREHGEVWLVLGTEFDVQLHGSSLQLPPMSGAILRA